MSELMRQALSTNQWTFDMLRDPDWQPDRDSYQSMRDGLVARLAAVEAERDMLKESLRPAFETTEMALNSLDRLHAAEQTQDALNAALTAAEARVEALTKAITHVIRDSPGTPDSVKTFLSRALSPLTPVPEQERNSE